MKYLIPFGMMLFSLLLIIPLAHAQNDDPAYGPGRVCEVTDTGYGTLSCRYYAYEGDVITLWCEGCRGESLVAYNVRSLINSAPRQRAWQFIDYGSDDTYDRSDTVLIESQDGEPLTFTVPREGMYRLRARFDFGTTSEPGEIYTYEVPGTERCGYIGCIPAETRSIEVGGFTSSNQGTIRTYIRLEEAGPDSPYYLDPNSANVTTPNEPDTTESPASSSEDTSANTRTSAPSQTEDEAEAVAGEGGLPTPLIFFALIGVGIVSLIVGFFTKRASLGAIVGLGFVGGAFVYILVIDQMGVDKLLDFAVDTGVMTIDDTISWRPSHNLFELTDVSMILGVSRQGMGFRNSYLYTLTADGDVRFAQGSYGSISPDGSQVVYESCEIRNNCTIWVRTIGASDSVELGEGIDPSWSPNGRQIAYRDANHNLVVVNADGSNRRQLHASIQEGSIRWSPDSRQLAFSENGLFIINADGTGLREILDQSGLLEWSPDGRRILYKSYTGDTAFVSNANGTMLREIPDARGVIWGANGATILRTEYGRTSIIDAELLLNTDTIEIIATLENMEFNYIPPIVGNVFVNNIHQTPDGYILYSLSDGGRNVGVEALLISPDGQQVRVVSVGETIDSIVFVR